MNSHPWTRQQLAATVEGCLILANGQRRGLPGAAPGAAVQAVASQTGRSPDDVRRVMAAAAGLMAQLGGPECRGLQPEAGGGASADELAVLEELLRIDGKFGHGRHRKLWSRSELRAVAVLYRQIVRAEAAGVPVDVTARLSELAASLGRTIGAVRFRMSSISWILAQSGRPVAGCIPAGSDVDRKVAAVVLDIFAELKAEEHDGADALWTEAPLRAALAVYRELAQASASGDRGLDADDCTCHLSQQTGRRFAPCRRCLDWIAALSRKRGGKAPAGLEPSEDMPEETRGILERLMDGGWGAP